MTQENNDPSGCAECERLRGINAELLEWVEIYKCVLTGEMTPSRGDLEAVKELLAKVKGN